MQQPQAWAPSSPPAGMPKRGKEAESKPHSSLAAPHLLKITTMYIKNRTKFHGEKFVCQCSMVDEFKMAETIGKKVGKLHHFQFDTGQLKITLHTRK